MASDNYFIPSGFGHAMPARTGIKAGDFKSLQAYARTNGIVPPWSK